MHLPVGAPCLKLIAQALECYNNPAFPFTTAVQGPQQGMKNEEQAYFTYKNVLHYCSLPYLLTLRHLRISCPIINFTIFVAVADTDIRAYQGYDSPYFFHRLSLHGHVANANHKVYQEQTFIFYHPYHYNPVPSSVCIRRPQKLYCHRKPLFYKLSQAFGDARCRKKNFKFEVMLYHNRNSTMLGH